MREDGRNCLKYLKRGWNRKHGREQKDFKMGEGEQAGSKSGYLKKEGSGSPLRTMIIKIVVMCHK